MTDRIKGLTIVLDRDYREDDVESIVDAIMMIRGVSHVTTEKVTTEDYFARRRVVNRIQSKVYDSLKEIFDEKNLNLT